MSDPILTRNLRLFHIYRLLSTSYLFVPVLVTFFQSRALDFTEIALLNTVYAITAIVFEVPTGVLADRFGRRRAMILGSLMMAAGCIVDWRGHGFWTFAVGEGLLALGLTLSSGADSAYLYDLLRSAGREHDYRRRESSATAAKLIGAALALTAGGLLARYDVAATYLVSSLVCVAAAAAASLLRERHDRAITEPRFFRAMLQAGGSVLSSSGLRFAVGFSVLVFTLLRMGLYLQAPYLATAGLEVAWIGLTLAALSLVAALASARFEEIRRLAGETRLVFAVPVVLMVTYGMLGHFVALWGIALFAVQSICNGIYSPFSKELLNRQIEDSGQRATVLSFESMARRLAFGAFAPVAGVFIDGHGLGAGLYACAALGASGLVLLGIQAITRRREGFGAFAGEVTPTPIPKETGDVVGRPSVVS